MISQTDMNMRKGDTKKFNCTVRDSEGKAFNLTGYTMTFTAKVNATDDDSAAIIQKEASIPSPASAKGEFILLPTETNIDVAEYVYDIQISDGADNVYTVAEGTVTVYQDVTRTI